MASQELPPDSAPAAAPAVACSVEGRLEHSHDLAGLLSALQLREREQRDQRIFCEASSRGLKFTAQSSAKDVAILGWIFHNVFQDYRFQPPEAELQLWLPLAQLLSCLQIFGEKAQVTFLYPYGPNDELQLLLEEDGATTECRLKTLMLGSAVPVAAFFAPGDTLSLFRPQQAEAWHQALAEFSELDAPDVALRLTLRSAAEPEAPALVLHSKTLSADAEVELPRSAFDELGLAPDAAAAGEVSFRYPLSGMLAASLRAARDAKAVKVRFNAEGVMSCQYILRARGPKDLFCEVLASPLAELAYAAAASGPNKRKSFAAGDSLGF